MALIRACPWCGKVSHPDKATALRSTPGSPHPPQRAAPGLPMSSRSGIASDFTPPSAASSQPTTWNHLAGPVVSVRLGA